MGSTEAQFRFKEELTRLCDPAYKLSSGTQSCEFLINHNLSFSELSQLLTPTECRNLRDSNIESFSTLLRSVSFRLIQLAKLQDVPLSSFPINKLLNSIRVLVILLPYLYESTELQITERNLFWSMENSVDDEQINCGNSPSSMTNTVGSNSASTSDSSNQLDSGNESISPNVNYNLKTESSAQSLKTTFGKSNFQSHVLGFKLVLVLVDLLFTSGLTVPITNVISKQTYKPLLANTLDFTVWEAGIGSFGNNDKYNGLRFTDPKLDLDSNRFEILRLLITLTSQCLFKTTSNLVPSGSRFLTVLTTSLPKLQVLTLISSLVNVTCRSTKSVNNGIDAINNQELRKIRVLFVTYVIQFFSLLIVYPLPKADVDFLKKLRIIDDSTNPNSINLIRFYCGKLHKDEELIFLENGLCNPLFELLNIQEVSRSKSVPNTQQHQQANSEQAPQSPSTSQQSGLSSFKTKILGSTSIPSPWSIELIILFWEFYQCNKKFRNFISVKKGSKLMIVLLHYIHTFKNNESYRNLVRLSSYLLLFLSHDSIITRTLVTIIPSAFFNSLPNSFKTADSIVTYRDFILIHSSSILLSDPPFLLVPTIVEWMYNLIPLSSSQQVVSSSPTASVSNGSIGSQTSPILSNRRSSSTSIHSTGSSNQSQRFSGDLMSFQTSSLLVQVVGKFSTLTVAGTGKDKDIHLDLNLDLLSLLIRALAHAILRSPDKHHYILIYTIFKNQNFFTGVLRNITVVSNELSRREKQQDGDDDIETTADNGRLSISSNTTTVESNKSPQMRPVVSRHSSQISISSAIGAGQPQLQQRHLSHASLYSTTSRNSIDSNPPLNDDGGNTLDSITEGVESSLIRPKLPTGMSEKAKSKQLLNASLEVSWNGINSLKVILHLIDYIKANIPASVLSSKDSAVIVNRIRSLDFKEFILSCKANGILITKEFLPVSISSNSLSLQGTVFEPLKFQWSNLSLGWYESVLWCSIYSNFEAPKNYNSKYGGGSNGVAGKGILDISNSIQAFKKVGHDWGFGWGSDNSSPGASANKELNGVILGVKRLQLTSEEDYMNIINDAVINGNAWSALKIKLFKINKQSGSNNTTKEFADNLFKRLGSISFRRDSTATSLDADLNSSVPPSPTAPFSQSLLNTPNPSGAMNIFKNQNPFLTPDKSQTSSPILGYFPPLDVSNEDDFDMYPNSNSAPGTPIYDNRSPKISISDDIVSNVAHGNRNSLSISRTYSRTSNLNSKANTPKVGTPLLSPQP